MKILRENKRKLTEDAESAEERIEDYLNGLSDSDAVQIWNEYCDSAGYYDDRIEDFDELTINELFSSPYDALRASYYGEVDFTHDYFQFNGYGNIITGYVSDFADWEDVANYAVTNDEDFGDSDIRDILDEEMNEEEEEEDEDEEDEE